MTADTFVFMFPGQGSQKVGMGKILSENFAEMASSFEEASDTLGFNMARLCFEDPEQQLNLTEYTQPALLTMSTGVLRVLQKHSSKRPTFVAGHSLGEYSALVAAGALSFREALKAVRFRGQAIQRATPVGSGAMSAYVGSNANRVAEICKKISANPSSSVEIVNFNSRTQLVLSGHKEAVDKASEQIVAEKLGKAIALSVSAPFHSTLMAPAAAAMQEYFGSSKQLKLGCTLVANVNAKPYAATEYSTNLLVEQVSRPVLWTQTLDTIVAQLNQSNVLQSQRKWIEVGAGNVLQGLLKKTLDGEQGAGTSDLEQLKILLES